MAQPTAISRYQIRDRLGHGGMGVLYLALDPAIDRLVAVKLLRVNNAEIRERFIREAQIAARLQHAHIVTIYDVGTHEGQPFIAMEYIAGETMGELIHRRAPLALSRKLELVADVCEGLAYAHKRGVVHRDVKPANLMVGRESGIVKILDFGIARTAGSNLTQVGMVMGTPNYMSPEQIAGQSVDHRSDIFAVGAVLYEVLVHRQAFTGDTPHAVLHQITSIDPPQVSAINPELDPELDAIIGRAMAKAPGDRYADLTAMRGDLQRVLQRIEAHQEGHTIVGEVAAPVARLTPTPTPRGSRTGPDRARIAERRAARIAAHLANADAALAAGQLDEALTEVELGAEVEPDDPRIVRLHERVRRAIDARDAARLLSEARAQLASGALTEAARLVSEAGQIAAGSPDVQALGREVDRAFEQRERLREQVRKAREAVDLAREYLDAGAFDAALRSASEALGYRPDDPDALAIRQSIRDAIDRRNHAAMRDARAHAADGRYDSAIRLLQGLRPADDEIVDLLTEVETARDEAARRQAAREQAERERRDREEAERERRERERAAREQAEREQAEREQAERAHREAEEERARWQAERDAAVRAEREQLQRERERAQREQDAREREQREQEEREREQRAREQREQREREKREREQREREQRERDEREARARDAERRERERLERRLDETAPTIEDEAPALRDSEDTLEADAPASMPRVPARRETRTPIPTPAPPTPAPPPSPPQSFAPLDVVQPPARALSNPRVKMAAAAAGLLVLLGGGWLVSRMGAPSVERQESTPPQPLRTETPPPERTPPVATPETSAQQPPAQTPPIAEPPASTPPTTTAVTPPTTTPATGPTSQEIEAAARRAQQAGDLNEALRQALLGMKLEPTSQRFAGLARGIVSKAAADASTAQRRAAAVAGAADLKAYRDASLESQRAGLLPLVRAVEAVAGYRRAGQLFDQAASERQAALTAEESRARQAEDDTRRRADDVRTATQEAQRLIRDQKWTEALEALKKVRAIDPAASGLDALTRQAESGLAGSRQAPTRPGTTAPDPSEAARAGISQLLDAFKRGYESRDLAAIRRLWPSMPQGFVDSYGRLFRDNSALSWDYQIQGMSLSSDLRSARVQCRVEVGQQGNRRTASEQRTYAFDVTNSGSAWSIANVTVGR